MKDFYITTLIINHPTKQNVKDIVKANDREEALAIVFYKYVNKGFEVVKQKAIEL